jgi:AmiR/NasT family two-component response regulator
MADALPQVLLVEPQFVLRRTLAAVAHEMQLAQVHEAPNLGVAERLAALRRYDVVVLSGDAAADGAAALAALVASTGAARALLLLSPQQPEPATPHAVLRKPVNVKAVLKVLARAHMRGNAQGAETAVPSGAGMSTELSAS